jgi:ATP-dependent DNA ligase
VSSVPTGQMWTYELKLDGYRLEAIRYSDRVSLYSRRHKNLTQEFPAITQALADLPVNTIDGELTALDPHGCPNFNLLQRHREARPHLVYFLFDILCHNERDVTQIPLVERRSLLRSVIQPSEHLFLSEWTTSAEGTFRFALEHKLEGVVAKRADSLYLPGRRFGSWTKTRNPEFVRPRWKRQFFT